MSWGQAVGDMSITYLGGQAKVGSGLVRMGRGVSSGGQIELSWGLGWSLMG